MPKFSANLSMLFKEVDFLDRFEKAAQFGFQGVEFLFPYDWDKEELQERIKGNNLEMVLFDFPAGHWGSVKGDWHVFPTVLESSRKA